MDSTDHSRAPEPVTAGQALGANSAEARLIAFSQLGHRLCSARTQPEAIRIILDIADNFFGWDASTFHSYSVAEDEMIEVVVVDHLNGKRRDFEPDRLPMQPTARMRQIMAEGAVLILREPPFQMPADSLPVGDANRPSASLMYVPVRARDNFIGMLSIQSYKVHAYTHADLEVLEALAGHAAGALERIQAEEKIKAFNHELENRIAERTAALTTTVGELEAFSYSVSHDMRAPLRSMHGFAQILLEDYSGKTLDPAATDYLARIIRSALRLDTLIQDVLHYAKVLRGEIKLHPVNFAALVGDVLDGHPQWHPPAAEIEIAENIPLVIANEALLSQCISNLLSNAIKFVAPGVQPKIQIFFESAGDKKIRLIFSDNGLGIAEEHHLRIFKMFERLHPAGDFEGTGIGLTIVRKAVERMHGELGFESELNRGSQFWIQLPAA
jgi:signal transduction histidine kinase